MNGIQENQKCEYVQNASRRIGIKQRGNDKPRAKHDSFILETLTVKRISVDKNNGIVISHCGKNKILKQYINDRGYCRITISMNNFPITVFVHRVVWISEYGVPQDPFLQINHIDNNPSNNSITNLELVTPKGNQDHCVKTGRRKTGVLLLTEEQIAEIKNDYIWGSKANNLNTLSKKYGVSKCTIWDALYGVEKTHHNQAKIYKEANGRKRDMRFVVKFLEERK